MTKSFSFVLSFAVASSLIRLVYYGSMFDESLSGILGRQPPATWSQPVSSHYEKKQSSLPAARQSPTIINNKNYTRPLFIFHVGPRKTGTSTIQNVAAVSQEYLVQDNIYYIGHHKKKAEINLHDLSELCLGNKRTQPGCQKKWDEFAETVHRHLQKKQHVLLSDETINRFLLHPEDKQFMFQQLKPILKGWRVRIAFTYRRYHTWIPSSYMQAFDPTKGNHNKTKRESWPDDGGREIPSFSVYFDRFWQQDDKQPLVVYQKWKDQYDNVKVFNMHQDNDFVSSFFCRTVPEAQALCKHLQSKNDELLPSKVKLKNSSTQKALHYDMLAARAYNHSLVEHSHSRVAVAHAIEEHAHQIGWSSLTDFPLDCLDDSQVSTLLNITLDLESKLIPDFYATPRGEKELRSNVKEYMNQGQFCSIDAEATLQDDRWKEFFAALKIENDSN